MAKAKLTLPNGTKVAIEGTEEEVATLVRRFSDLAAEPTGGGRTRAGRTARAQKVARAKKAGKSAGPVGHIRELRDQGFFKSKRSINDVQEKLEEKGQIYALTNLSPALLWLVRARPAVLGRIKEGGVWKYVQR